MDTAVAVDRLAGLVAVQVVVVEASVVRVGLAEVEEVVEPVVETEVQTCEWTFPSGAASS